MWCTNTAEREKHAHTYTHTHTHNAGVTNSTHFQNPSAAHEEEVLFFCSFDCCPSFVTKPLNLFSLVMIKEKERKKKTLFLREGASGNLKGHCIAQVLAHFVSSSFSDWFHLRSVVALLSLLS